MTTKPWEIAPWATLNLGARIAPCWLRPHRAGEGISNTSVTSDRLCSSKFAIPFRRLKMHSKKERCNRRRSLWAALIIFHVLFNNSRSRVDSDRVLKYFDGRALHSQGYGVTSRAECWTYIVIYKAALCELVAPCCHVKFWQIYLRQIVWL